MAGQRKPETVDEYISLQPLKVREKLEGLRSTVRAAAPLAEEKISYGMPAYFQDGVIVYFASHKGHISLYPFPTAMEAFEDEIKAFRTSKGTMQFRHSGEIPLDLITEIVKFRLRENEKRKEEKKTGSRKKKNETAGNKP